MIDEERIGVLFVCMGNICRSPTAEGVFRRMVAQAGLEAHVRIDSAGTHAYHVGAPPDRRAQAAAHQRGYDLSALRGRQVEARDFADFDYILAMDDDNLSLLSQRCPADHAHKLALFLSFSARFPHEVVPDPYYGGPQGFESVLDRVEDAGRGLLEEVRARLATRSGKDAPSIA
ncbi:MAG: low molecular weight phosphotyrosine protein phosphatase [Betaproteobacteria bacterium]|nr:low molecular weight phosphotyrosine protein phosphatase [Betaproteobacteria bacterium]